MSVCTINAGIDAKGGVQRNVFRAIPLNIKYWNEKCSGCFVHIEYFPDTSNLPKNPSLEGIS